MELFNFIAQVPLAQALGVVLLIGIAERSGIPVVSIIKKVLKLNGNGHQSGLQPQIDELHEHARVANSEMGEIRKDISDIKADVAFIRGLITRN